MEFNARYFLVSIFTLATVLGVFLFVLWLNNTGGFGEKVEYQVRFSVPVSGLAKGSNVLFNGIKVGEIIALNIDQKEPSNLVALISVSNETPVRQDTIVGVDFQGMTGAANILLTGGSPTSLPLVKNGNDIPVLIAKPSDSTSWTQSAAKVLSRIDGLFGDNKNRFDSILTGLERMTGGAEQSEIPVFDLDLPKVQGSVELLPEWQMVISEPTVVLAMNTDKILEETASGTWNSRKDGRWADNIPNLFQTKIIQSFEDAGYAGAILRPADSLDPQYRLVMDIRSFHFRTYDQPAAVIELMVKMIDRDGNVIASKRFFVEKAAGGADAPEIISSLKSVFASAASEMIEWSVAALQNEN